MQFQRKKQWLVINTVVLHVQHSDDSLDVFNPLVEHFFAGAATVIGKNVQILIRQMECRRKFPIERNVISDGFAIAGNRVGKLIF